MTFISIHSIIVYVVFFGVCMRYTRFYPLNPGVTSDACMSHLKLFENNGWSGGAVCVILERASSWLAKVGGTTIPSLPVWLRRHLNRYPNRRIKWTHLHSSWAFDWVLGLGLSSCPRRARVRQILLFREEGGSNETRISPEFSLRPRRALARWSFEQPLSRVSRYQPPCLLTRLLQFLDQHSTLFPLLQSLGPPCSRTAFFPFCQSIFVEVLTEHLTCRNLEKNDFVGTLPYSISQMASATWQVWAHWEHSPYSSLIITNPLLTIQNKYWKLQITMMTGAISSVICRTTNLLVR